MDLCHHQINGAPCLLPVVGIKNRPFSAGTTITVAEITLTRLATGQNERFRGVANHKYNDRGVGIEPCWGMAAKATATTI
jgi:hypothetical protein